MTNLNKFRKEVLIKRIQQDKKTIKYLDEKIKQLKAGREKALDFMLMARKLQYDRPDLTEIYICESIKTLESKE